MIHGNILGSLRVDFGVLFDLGVFVHVRHDPVKVLAILHLVFLEEWEQGLPCRLPDIAFPSGGGDGKGYVRHEDEWMSRW